MATDVEVDRPLIVGIGGSTRPGSSSERVLGASLEAAEERGARTQLIGAAQLRLEPYEPGQFAGSRSLPPFVEAIRNADGIIIASPGYHGGISGLLKNALDYLEEIRQDARPYLDGRAVGCIACAGGWQAANSTLAALRDVVHALRGWPTPIGVAVNTAELSWAPPSRMPRDPHLVAQLDLQARQVVDFAVRWRAGDPRTASGQHNFASPG